MKQDLDVRIADAVKKHGVNVAELSRRIGVHQETIRYRMRTTLHKGLRTIINHGAFGLTPAWFIYDTAKINFDSLANPFVRFVEQTSDGKTWIYLNTPDTFRIYNHVPRENFSIEEMYGTKTRHLKTPDEYDSMIVFSKEADPRITISKISRKTRVNQKTMDYHNRAHVEGKLILGYDASIPLKSKEEFIYRFNCGDEGNCTKLFSALKSLPRARRMEKIFNSPEILSHIELPAEEKRKFTEDIVAIGRTGAFESLSVSEIVYRSPFQGLPHSLYHGSAGWRTYNATF